MVGSIDVEKGEASLELGNYPKDHPLASLKGSENILIITTTRYCTHPLIIRGPGAGASVTAGGVFGDLLTVLQQTSWDLKIKE